MADKIVAERGLAIAAYSAANRVLITGTSWTRTTLIVPGLTAKVKSACLLADASHAALSAAPSVGGFEKCGKTIRVILI